MYPQTDNNQKLKSRLILLAVLIAVMILGYIGFLIYRSATFHVVSTDPPLSKVATVSTYFDINFNRILNPSPIKVTASSNIINSYAVKNESIDITLNVPLSSNNTYTIRVSGISDTKGETMSNQIFSFKPVYIESQDLTPAQKKALSQMQLKYNQKHNDPILSHLPYSTPNFTLSYTYQNSKLVLNASIFVPQAFANNPQAAISQDKQAIIQYIQSLGLNPSNYTIQYNTTQG